MFVDMFIAVAVPLLVQGLAGEISKMKPRLVDLMARLTRWRNKDVYIRKIAYEKVKGCVFASSRFTTSLENVSCCRIRFYILVTGISAVCVARVEWQS